MCVGEWTYGVMICDAEWKCGGPSCVLVNENIVLIHLHL